MSIHPLVLLQVALCTVVHDLVAAVVDSIIVVEPPTTPREQSLI